MMDSTMLENDKRAELAQRKLKAEKLKAEIIETYGQGPAYEIRDKVDGVQTTNVSGVKWYFRYSSEYKALKKQIADNRRERRKI